MSFTRETYSFGFGPSASSSLGRIIGAASKWDSSGAPLRNPFRTWDYLVLVYSLDGRAWYADETGRERVLNPGDMILLFPGIGHGFGPEKGNTWSEMFVIMEGPVCDLWVKTKVADPEKPFYRTGRTEYWAKRFRDIFGQPDDTGVYRTEERLYMIGSMLSELNRRREDYIRPAKEKIWLKEAVSLMEEGNLAEPRLEHIAGRLHMSYENFRKRFKRLTGSSPGIYRAEVVMRKACALLREDKDTSAAIAGQLGFSDEYHFSKRFRQVLGISPREYKKNMT